MNIGGGGWQIDGMPWVDIPQVNSLLTVAWLEVTCVDASSDAVEVVFRAMVIATAPVQAKGGEELLDIQPGGGSSEVAAQDQGATALDEDPRFISQHIVVGLGEGLVSCEDD